MKGDEDGIMVKSFVSGFQPPPSFPSVGVSMYYMQGSPLFINSRNCPLRLDGNGPRSHAVVSCTLSTVSNIVGCGS